MYQNYGLPTGYQAPRQPYGKVPGNVAARVDFLVLSVVPAAYSGDDFQLLLLGANGVLGPLIRFEFYVSPAPPPAPPSIGIDLAGLVTLEAIAAQIGVVVASQGFTVVFNIAADGFTVFQPYPGARGNGAIAVDSSLAGELEVNGQATFEGRTLFFYNGQSAIPALWGPQRGLLFTALETPPVILEEA